MKKDDGLNSPLTSRISVKLTKYQKEEVDRRAMLKGLSTSTYIRMILLKDLYKREDKKLLSIFVWNQVYTMYKLYKRLKSQNYLILYIILFIIIYIFLLLLYILFFH